MKENRPDKITGNEKVKKKEININHLFLFIAVILGLIGLWLTWTEKSAEGISDPGRYGQGGGTSIRLTGPIIIALGLFFALFPLLDFIRYLKKGK